MKGLVALGRLDDLRSFYGILGALERKTNGTRALAHCTGFMNWPTRGVYFFREVGEDRADTGTGPRIVRVGTHAIRVGARRTLWGRLRQHRGTIRPPGGNHRTSIFRGHVGAALIERNGLNCPSWRWRGLQPRSVRDDEVTLEREVSAVIGAMPFLWLEVPDEPGPESLRAHIESNAIALLSNFRKPQLDPPSRKWLGARSDRERVRESGLWNSNHVGEQYEPRFLEILESAVDKMEAA